MPNKGMTSNAFSMELVPKSKKKLLRKMDRLEKWLPEVTVETMVLVGELIATETTGGDFPEQEKYLKNSYHVETPDGIEWPRSQMSPPNDLLVGGTQKFLNRPDNMEVMVGSSLVYAWWIETGQNRTTGARRRTRNGVNAFINAYIHWKSTLLRKIKNQVSKKIARV